MPGLLHLHGGGQRAFRHEVEFYARRGYACLSVNWGGREMEDARPGDPNTDWGAVDPTQTNVPGYANLKPGEKYLAPFDSPRNNNWYLLTLGARRGLTFLEQQPEVDADKLGVYGHSMGGNLTVYVAGSDSRVKAAAPSVGASGSAPGRGPCCPSASRRCRTATRRCSTPPSGLSVRPAHQSPAPVAGVGETRTQLAERVAGAVGVIRDGAGRLAGVGSELAPESVRFAKARDRSVTGSMNELVAYAEVLLADGGVSVPEVGVRLNDLLLSAAAGEGEKYGTP